MEEKNVYPKNLNKVEEELVAKYGAGIGTYSPGETSTLTFKYFPDFAAFIGEKHLIPFLAEEILISREMKFPLIKLVEGKTDDEIIESSLGSNRHFLDMIAENRAQEFLENFLNKWREKGLPGARQEELTIEDVQYINMIRKRAFTNLLPRYTTDPGLTLDISKELDHYFFVFNLQLSSLYASLLKEQMAKQKAGEDETIATLKENERQLLKMQELAKTGSWTWDLGTNKIEWTDALYQIYGIEPGATLTFDHILSYNDPDYAELVKGEIRKTLTSLTPAERYYRIRSKNGARKTLYAKTEIITNAEGQPCKVAGIIQDLTERQDLVEQLMRSEHLYKQAQSISHIGNWSWNTATDEIVWSDEMYQIYELDHKVTHLKLLTNHVPVEDRQMLNDSIRHTLKTREPYDINYRIMLKDGRIKTLNARGRVHEQNSHLLVGTLQDVTMQKVYEKQMNEYKDFIEKITNVAPSLIRSYNVNTGEYLFVNNAFETLLGYPPSRLAEGGMKFMTSLVHPEDLEGVLEQSNRILNEANRLPTPGTEPISEFKYRIRNSKGQYRWFQTYETIFERNTKGKVETVINVSIDITDKVKAEQDLHKKNIQLQFSNKNLEEYAYVVSHDLKEPLRKIATFSDRILLTQGNLFTEEGKTYFKKIITSVERMQKMIDDLLSVSTIMGNKAYLPSDLNILLTEGMQPLDHKMEENNTTVESEILPVASVVPSQFRQIFQNLLSNSIKFGKPETPVRVRVTHEFLDNNAVEGLHVQKAKKYLKLVWEDNGIGFDNEYAGKIFEIFQRLHGKTEYEGTGIGLAICKKIMENHGGVMYASGKANAGATFTMVFPVKSKT